MSDILYNTDTRFGKCDEIRKNVELICGHKIVHTIQGAEPFGPSVKLDALIISPCTGNTLAKLACGITDTAVCMAAKAHLRNGRPLVIAVSTNDALGASARNIGTLMNAKNVYFVPMGQDSPEGKPASMVAHFEKSAETIESALSGKQLQPLIY
jgi:dipicolinate synthase subunit B